MTQRIIAGVVLVLLVAAMLYTRATSHVSLNRRTTSQVAPDFALKDLNGNTVRLSDFRGKAVVLNFWATWFRLARKRFRGSSTCRTSTVAKVCKSSGSRWMKPAEIRSPSSPGRWASTTPCC